jgi:hypothetical protein
MSHSGFCLFQEKWVKSGMHRMLQARGAGISVDVVPLAYEPHPNNRDRTRR